MNAYFPGQETLAHRLFACYVFFALNYTGASPIYSVLCALQTIQMLFDMLYSAGPTNSFYRFPNLKFQFTKKLLVDRQDVDRH